MIWKHPKYVEGRKFYELFDSKKILARARSEYSTTYAKKTWFLSFHSDVRFGARAKNFFGNVIFMIKSRCKFFCLVITQKANFLEQFEVWNFFRKFDFFQKIWIWKIFEKFWFFFLDFSWKNPIFKSIYSNRFKRYKNFENT